MDNYTVYKHTNSATGLAYIGMTCQKPIRRWKNGNGYRGNKRFSEDIAKYGWGAFTHTIIASNLSENEARKLEKEMIDTLELRNPGNGYNRIEGGIKCGMTNKTQSETSKRKISEARKRNGFTDEHKKHISISKTGINHHFAKKVYQYDKDGGFIKEWEYMSEAAMCLNIKKTNISECCLGKRRTAGGYVWRYDRRG